MRRNRIQILLGIVLLAGLCFAQSEAPKTPAPEGKFFHLEFVVKEVNAGKTINSRSYGLTVSTERNSSASTRNGSRVPVKSGDSFQFLDIGTNLDCRDPREVATGLALSIAADITSPATEPDARYAVVRTIRWSSPVVVPLRKPTIVFTSDDPSSKNQFQLEVTATPIQ